MNSVSVDMKDILVTDGLGYYGPKDTDVWGIFIGNEPTAPNTTITLYDGETLPLKSHTDKDEEDEAANFQARVRGMTYEEARAKLQEVVVALNRKGLFHLNDTKYSNIFTVGGKVPLGMDDNKRYIWVQNFTAYREDE